MVVTRLDILKKFQAKARCAHTERAAGFWWKRLHPRLTTAQLSALRTAWVHINLGEGPAELDGICKEIEAEWAT